MEFDLHENESANEANFQKNGFAQRLLFETEAKAISEMAYCVHYHCKELGRLSNTRWQRKRHQTKGLMSKTMAEHVRYNYWYISLPSSAKQLGIGSFSKPRRRRERERH